MTPSMIWMFLAGCLVGVNAMAVVHVCASRRWQFKERDLRQHFSTRLDEIRDWSNRSLDQNRRDLGLPPRQVQ